MSKVQVGSFVTHAKLMELGSGEVISIDRGEVRIRFASGDRAFVGDLALAHLTTTDEPPAPAKAAPKRARKAKAADKA